MATVSELTSKNIASTQANVQTWGTVLYNVKVYGAKGDGVTDDTAAIQAAIDAAELAGGGIVFFPEGTYIISSKLTVTNAVLLLGAGKGETSNNANSSGLAVSKITWGASTGDTMLEFKSATSNYYLFSIGISNVLINGNNIATRGVYAASVHMSHFEKLQIRKCTEAGLVIDGGNGVLASHNFVNDYHYVWGANVACENSHGLVLGNTTDALTAQTYIGNIQGLVKNGHFLLFNGTDNNVVEKVQGSVQGTGKSVYFANGVTVARNNLIKYVTGSVHAESNTFGNRILHSISEGVGSGVSVDSGAQIHYTAEDYSSSDVFETHKYIMSDQKDIPLGSMLISTTATVGVAASLWACYNLPDGSTSRIGTFVPPDYNWNNGTLQTLRIWFTTDTSNTSDQWVARIKALLKDGDSTALSTPSFDTSFNIPVTDAINRSQYYDVTLDMAYTRDRGLLLSIQRTGADANDTALGNVQILGIALIYEGTGPDSAGSGTYAVTLPYK